MKTTISKPFFLYKQDTLCYSPEWLVQIRNWILLGKSTTYISSLF